uniref:26S proteasome non-ATPase regulatory subunit 3 isoform X1 n=1 Tax=Hirondellea gigas TaxID=1518452 RepID=A0A6A7FYD6_9CRUS
MATNEASKDKDVEMEDVDKTKEKEKDEESPTVELTPQLAILNEIRSTIHFYERGVQSKSPRLRSLSIRSIHRFRSKLTAAFLKQIIEQFIPLKTAKVRRDTLLLYLSAVKDDVDMETSANSDEADLKSSDTPMDIDTPTTKTEKSEKEVSSDSEKKSSDEKSETKEKKPQIKVKDLKKLEEVRKAVTIEIECLLQLIIVILLSDRGQEENVIKCAKDLLERTTATNIRTLDLISARAYFYVSLAYSRTNKLDEIRTSLLAAYRTCCLRHDEPGQAVLANLILQNYLHYNLFSQADKFRLNSNFPAQHGGPYQHARYLYFIGRINCVQLHYSEALQNLSQAVRKAPQTAAVGFRQLATKFLVIVQLLLGEIPERSVFGVSSLKRSLHPYFKLTQAVRAGDSTKFNEVMKAYSPSFQKDGAYTLIVRLRHNVIKTGLRNISLSYSRISLGDIASKLSVGSVEDTEFIVAKAIHDGVINAVIDKEHGYISSKLTSDVYSTYEPQMQFHKRIKFCMEIHNESVKALRYPDKPRSSEEQTPIELDIEEIDDAQSGISDDSDSHGDVM